jgi:hypothetical protein
MINLYCVEEDAKVRCRDFLRAAEHARLVRQAREGAPGRFDRLRGSIGKRLAAWRQWLWAPVEAHQA